MADITKKQITNYMGTLDTGTANGKVVMNQLKKAISMNESADIPFKDSINKKLQTMIVKTLASPMAKPPKPKDKIKNPFGKGKISVDKLKAAPMPKISKPKGKRKGPFGDAPPVDMPNPKNMKLKRTGGKVYSNTQSRKVRI